MIRDEIRRAWREDPCRVVLSTLAIIPALGVIYVLTVAFLLVGGSS